jgi:dihydrofolate reductase
MSPNNHPRLSLIVACAENRVIGHKGGMPWHIRSELKHFKSVTQTKPVIMGSKTWASLPKKPLPGRLNIVLSLDLRFEAEGGVLCSGMFEALELARDHATDEGLDEFFIIGGAKLYEQTLSQADRIYMTLVHANPQGDTYFPELDPANWVETQSQFHARAEHDDYDFTVKIFGRV